MNQMRPRQHRIPTVIISDCLFFALLFSIPFEDSVSIMGMSIPKLIGIVFIATAMVNWRRYFGKSPPAVTAYLLVVIIGVLSDIVQLPFLNINLVNELMRPTLVFITFFVAYNLCINGQIKRMMLILAAASATFATLSILGFGQDMGYVQEAGRNLVNVDGEQLERATAFGTNPNASSRVLSLPILFSVLIVFGIMPCKVVWQRIMWLLGGGISFIVFMQAASRGGAAGLAFGLMAIMLTSRKLGGKVLSYITVTLAIGFLIFSITHNELFRYRVEAEVEDRTLGGRVVLWTAAMEVFREAPVFGQGFFYHAYHIGEKVNKESRSAHNTFLGVLAATGSIGFAFYLIFWFYTIKSAWKIRKDKSGVGKVLFVWFAMGLVGALMMGMQNSKWLMVVMAMILGRYKLWIYEQQQWHMPGHSG